MKNYFEELEANGGTNNLQDILDYIEKELRYADKWQPVVAHVLGKRRRVQFTGDSYS